MATDRLYGTEISYRAEMRDKGAHPTIVLSTKVGYIPVHANPTRIGIEHWTRIKGQFGQPGFLRVFLPSLVDRLFVLVVAAWCRAYVEGALEKNSPSLPLGILLRGLGNELRSEDVSPTTKNRQERAIEALLEHEGSTPWDLVTPDHCRSQSWFSATEPSKRIECAAVMHRLYAARQYRGVCQQDPWSGFWSSLQPKEPSLESLQRRYLSEKALNNTVVRRVLDDCLSIGDSVSIAIILILISRLTIEEVCALSFGDLIKLNFFDVHALAVTEVYRRVNRNYRVQATSEERAAILPVPTMAANLINHLRTDAENSNNAKAKDNIDVLPIVAQLGNRCARITPTALTKEINNRLNYIDVPQGQSLIGLLQHTAATLADECGFDDDQFRYFLRYSANSTAAKSYASFISEDDLLGMVMMMDQKLKEIVADKSNICIHEEKVEENSFKTHSFEVQDGSYTTVKVKFRVSKKDINDLLAVRLFAASGYSANIKIKNLEEQDAHRTE